MEGTVTERHAAVAEAFAQNFTERDELGAAFAAWVDGEPVVDLWGGTADAGTAAPWTRDTLVPIFSGTKGMVAACLLLLLDRGLLDLERPVAAYWPEFAAAGKGDILVRHVVSHQAGLPGVVQPVTVSEATDPLRMAALIAEQPAIEPPGSRVIYHALTFGWICGELIRRIDGRGAGRFFAQELAGPLGLDAWIGLPAAQELRVARLRAAPDTGVVAEIADPVARSIWGNPPRFAAGKLAADTAEWHAAEVPGGSAVADARSMAALYGALPGLVSPATLALALRPLADGYDPYLGIPLTFGVGFQLQNEGAAFGPVADGFGHVGTGGSVHGAWPGLGVGFSYAMNGMGTGVGGDPRAAALLEALAVAVS